jgi:ABC-type amino acid transport system permease subunit
VTATLLLGASFLGDVWSFVQDNFDDLAAGIRRTLQVSLIAILGASVIGITLGAARAQIFMLFFALPQIGIRLEAFTVAWLAVTIWGGAFNTENFRAGFEAVPARYREAGAALGFTGLATFANITLPIGGRIALPSSINTYISIVKNTSLMYVIAYPEITTVVFQIQALTLQTAEAFTTLALTYLIIVWSMSALIRLLESHLALPEDRR